MSKEEKLDELLKKFKVERVCDRIKKKEYFICAKPLTAAQKEILIEKIQATPEFEIMFEVGPKVTTLNSFPLALLQRGLLPSDINIENGILSIRIDYEVDAEKLADILSVLIPILRNDGFFEGLIINSFEKQIAYRNFAIADTVAKNNKGKDTITKDNILDLQILLGNCSDIDTFLKSI